VRRSAIDPALLPSSSWPANNIYRCCNCCRRVVRELRADTTWSYQTRKKGEARAIPPTSQCALGRRRRQQQSRAERYLVLRHFCISGGRKRSAISNLRRPETGATGTRPRESCGKFVNKIANRRGFALIAKWMCEVNVRGDRVKHEHIIWQARKIESFRLRPRKAIVADLPQIKYCLADRGSVLWRIANKSFKHSPLQSRSTQVSDYCLPGQLIVFDKTILTHCAIGHLSSIQLLSHSPFCVTSRL